MSKEQAIEETMNDCKKILERSAELVEDFIDGKMPEKYGTTIMAKNISSEMGINLTLVAPVVALFVKRDNRVESNKGRYNGGLCLSPEGRLYKENKVK